MLPCMVPSVALCGRTTLGAALVCEGGLPLGPHAQPALGRLRDGDGVCDSPMHGPMEASGTAATPCAIPSAIVAVMLTPCLFCLWLCCLFCFLFCCLDGTGGVSQHRDLVAPVWRHKRHVSRLELRLDLSS